MIAEDAAIMRDGLTQTLTRRGHEVVAAVGDADALRQAVDAHRPDVAIIDVRMPPTHTDEGLRAAQAIRRDHPGVGVLVFSQYIETHVRRRAVRRRPSGRRLPAQGPRRRRQRLHRRDHPGRAGGTVLDPEVVRQLLRRQPPAPTPWPCSRHANARCSR